VARAPDVIVVGGGIAGLAAACRIKDRGLTPLVIEAASRVGGRMTTDRVNGFAIDTGVTLLGNRFRGMRQLARRVGLPLTPVGFSLAIRDRTHERRYRAQNPFDLACDSQLSLAAKIAFARIVGDVLAKRRGMLHGQSHLALSADSESVDDYVGRLGVGGQELLAKVFEPGMRAALGGGLAQASRLVFEQIVWNTLGAGFWNFDGGVDRLPNGLANEVSVELATEVLELRTSTSGVEVDLRRGGTQETRSARAAILAIPGNRIPAIFPGAPAWMLEPVCRTSFTGLSSAHVALDRMPQSRRTGYGLMAGADELHDGVGVLELEHLRAPGRCPPKKAMVSVYFVDSPTFQCLDADDVALRNKATAVLERVFPDTAGTVEFVHIVRWPTAIAVFPKGRLREMAALERRLACWDTPVDLAGDWLDGVASESAVQTGLRAADRMANRLRR